MSERYNELKIGDTFSWDGFPVKLIQVIEDKSGQLWAIILGSEGVPYVIVEDEIPIEAFSVILTLPNPNVKKTIKKGKKK